MATAFLARMTDLSRRYKLTLLLRSFLDAQPGLHKDGDDIGYVSHGKKSGAGKAPLHVGESRDLWRQGSYPELDRWLRRLAEESPRQHHAVWLCYVYQPPRRPRNVDNHELRKLKYVADSEEGLRWLEGKLPRNLRVPIDVQENAGVVRRPV